MICSKLENCALGNLNSADLPECDNHRSLCMKSSDKRSRVRCEEKVYL